MSEALVQRLIVAVCLIVVGVAIFFSSRIRPPEPPGCREVYLEW